MNEQAIHKLFADWWAGEYDGETPNHNGLGYETNEQDEAFYYFRAGVVSVVKKLNK